MSKLYRYAMGIAIAAQGVIAIVSAQKDNDVAMIVAAFTAAVLLVALIAGEMQQKKKREKK